MGNRSNPVAAAVRWRLSDGFGRARPIPGQSAQGASRQTVEQQV